MRWGGRRIWPVPSVHIRSPTSHSNTTCTSRRSRPGKHAVIRTKVDRCHPTADSSAGKTLALRRSLARLSPRAQMKIEVVAIINRKKSRKQVVFLCAVDLCLG